MKPVCLVLGAGRGIGANVGTYFADHGYHACLVRRSNQEALNESISLIQKAGNLATGYLMNVIEDDSVEDLIKNIEQNIGPIEVLVYNLGAQSGMKLLSETSYKEFEWAWRIANLGLFRTAQSLIPLMQQREKGTFLVTSATAAMRGNKNQHSHASAMGGRRMLCQSLNAEFASKGIHIAHIIIDGMVDAPDTLGKMLGEKEFNKLKEYLGSSDLLISPLEIAKTYYQIHLQHRSAWTHELNISSYLDKQWWND